MECHTERTPAATSLADAIHDELEDVPALDTHTHLVGGKLGDTRLLLVGEPLRPGREHVRHQVTLVGFGAVAGQLPLFPTLAVSRANSRSEARAEAVGVGSTALILIEAPSSAYPSGMLVVGTVTKKRRRPHAILHQTAQSVLRY